MPEHFALARRCSSPLYTLVLHPALQPSPLPCKNGGGGLAGGAPCTPKGRVRGQQTGVCVRRAPPLPKVSSGELEEPLPLVRILFGDRERQLGEATQRSGQILQLSPPPPSRRGSAKQLSSAR